MSEDDKASSYNPTRSFQQISKKIHLINAHVVELAEMDVWVCSEWHSLEFQTLYL